MPRIFISYRRDDTLSLTGRVFDRLKSYFDPESVVMDIDSIPLGADFRQYITHAIGECNILLAVIGDRWLGPETNVKKRIDDPTDFVRLEIETALSQGLLVIPVLVGTTPMPSEDDLPLPLKSLAYRNALRVDAGRDFHHHMDRLIQALDRLPGRRNVQVRQESFSPNDSDLNREPSQDAMPAIGCPRVELVSGPDIGKTFVLIKDRVLIGRDHNCDIAFDTAFITLPCTTRKNGRRIWL